MESIGSHTAKYLRSLAPADITEDQKKLLEDYDNRHLIGVTDQQREFTKQYNEKIKSVEKKSELKISKDDLWKKFNVVYEKQNRAKFELTSDSLTNIMPIMYYFLKDKEFFKCLNLSNVFHPSFEKGLLLIGGYGNGKSSIMKAIQTVLQSYGHSFAFKNMNDIVTEYEQCEQPEDKKTFWHYVTRGNCLFDDVKTEREASNYGKANLFKDIFEKRYLNNEIITHITCNYSDDYSYDLEKGIEEFGLKYGGRVYDRMSEKFNVIEFKGKSMRK